MTDNEVAARIRALLARETTLTLATVGIGGEPAAAALFYYADEELNLYWLSSRGSRHSVNLRLHPRAAVTVQPAAADWRAICGVQMEGLAGELAESEPVLTTYCARFGLGPELMPVVAASTVYVFRPDWVRYLDNARSFGWKAELRPGARSEGG